MFEEEYWQPSIRWASRDNARLFIEQDEIPAGSLFRGFARLTQETVEVLASGASNVRLTQQPIEVLAKSSSNVTVTQLFLEVLQAPPQQIEDEYWINWVKPVEAKLWQSLPIGSRFLDPDEWPTPVAPPAPQIDEDYWINSVRPVAARLYQKLPLGDPEEISAGYLQPLALAKLTQELVEVLAKSASNVISTQELVEVLAASSSRVDVTQFVVEFLQLPEKQVEHEYWLNWVQPQAASLYQRLPIGDPEQIPAGSLLAAQSVWEEYWQNPVRPVAASLYRSPAFVDQDEYPALFAMFAKLTQMVVEVMMSYQYNVYTGYTGVSMSVS